VTDIKNPLGDFGTGRHGCALATPVQSYTDSLCKWNGYEQATEGDSFLLAFTLQAPRWGFTMQLQTSLLEEAAWEPELFATPCAHSL
jgi:hypothetical protein